jgi:hypothetical protein
MNPMSAASIPPPSEEQLAIVENLGRGFNVIVNSVAGSGKTTTSLHVAKGNSFLRPETLLLTYNARLKDETRMRAKAMGLHRNMEVHSFHAFGKLFCEIHTSLKINDLLLFRSQVLWRIVFQRCWNSPNY